MGKFHPLIVHLPIGILLLNALFVFLSKLKRFENLSVALPITTFLGALSVVTACVTGWLLAENGGYSDAILSYHKWLGIGLAVLSVGIYFSKKIDNIWLWVLVVAVLSVTGHFGGTLTHGENYLFSSETAQNTEGGNSLVVGGKLVENRPSDIQEAQVYAHLIVPILKEKCYSCHNANKQKGKLRMDEKAAFLAGGANGSIVLAGQSEQSEMIKRQLLDLNDEHHMPPKGKPQPTAQELTLLRWWIDNGLDFDKKVKELPQNDTIKAVFAHFSNGNNESVKKENPFLPTVQVEKAEARLIDSVRKKGILLMSVAPGSPFLQANFVSVQKAGDEAITELLPFKNQIVWLKLGGTKITDEALSTVAQMPNLTRLHLENTRITDKGLAKLTSLQHLRYLNIVGTDVTTAGIYPLSILPHLEQIFMFKTTISADSFQLLKQKMPRTYFDTGGYQVPTFVSDTTEFKKVR